VDKVGGDGNECAHRGKVFRENSGRALIFLELPPGAFAASNLDTLNVLIDEQNLEIQYYLYCIIMGAFFDTFAPRERHLRTCALTHAKGQVALKGAATLLCFGSALGAFAGSDTDSPSTHLRPTVAAHVGVVRARKWRLLHDWFDLSACHFARGAWELARPLLRNC
jgi:hypothetical protein